MIAYTHRPLLATVDLSAPGLSGRGAGRGAVRALSLLAALYAAASLLALSVASFVPDSLERSWFDSGPDPFMPEDPGRAKAALDRLLRPGGLRLLQYRISVSSLGPPNAWARPGGRIYVSSTLLAAAKTEVGLAAVVAHELGHHEQRHILTRFSRAVFVQLPAHFLLNRLKLRAGEETVALVELSHERDEETEADDFALRRVFLAYGRVDEALEFFEYIAKLEPKNAGAARFLRTHPLSDARLQHLRLLRESLQKGVPPPVI